MNIVNRILMKGVLLPTPLYDRLGVNVLHLRTILQMKLMIDDRRPNTVQQTKKTKREKPISMATVGTMLLSLLYGCFYLIAFGLGETMVTQLTIFFSFFIFMLAASLISDFTSVLIDIRDNFIILPKPVSDRTVVVARLLHILIHISKLLLPMTIPALIYVGIDISAYASLVLFITCLLATLFAVFLVNAVYILILKITTPQRFQSIITQIQVVFAVILYASYQVIPRMLGSIQNIDQYILNNKWLYLAPPYWFANTWELLFVDKASFEVGAAIIGLIAPFLCIVIVVRFLAPSFNRKLSMINASSDSTPQPVVSNERTERITLSEKLSRIFTRSAAERMGFMFTWKMSTRSKDFKLKVYPSFGYLLVYIVVMGMNKGMTPEKIRSAPETVEQILMVSIMYGVGILLLSALAQTNYSEKFKASWIYYTTPVVRPGEIIKGSLLALLVKFYVPIAILFTVAGISFFGTSVIPNVILGISNQVLIASVVKYMSNREFPFSLFQDQTRRSGGFMKVVFKLIIIGVIGTGHYFVYNFPVVVMIFAVMSLIANWLLLDAIKRTDWKQVQENNAIH